VLSIVERSRFHDVFVRSVSTGVLATLAAAPIGLVTLDLAQHGPLTPLILAPLAIAVALNSKYAIAQRDEHMRFERLYESLARTAGISALEDALGALAAEARSLGTASAGLCCATGLDDIWLGALADDHGHAPASADAVAAAVALADRMTGKEVDVADAPELTAITPGAKHAIVLSSVDENGRRVVLVVVRDASVNAAAKSRVETLEAFAYQAALIVSNAVLHEERAVALARQIDLNRQKSDFVAAVSHELRTPLGVMLGSVHTLERLGDRVTDAQRRQLFDMTLEQGTRLQRLIDELLLVAAAEHATVQIDEELFDATDALDSVASGLNAAVRARLRVHSDAGNIVCDRSKLERILLNLVENAGKYAPDGTIELRATRIDGDVHFSVIDHGPGIPPTERERVFERFVQLDQSSTRRQGGTGLGLHLCRQLTGLIEGQLVLHETDGGGCTFTLILPIVEQPFAQREQPEPRHAVLSRPAFLDAASRQVVS
jgi:signal transduction histidine kinase